MTIDEIRERAAEILDGRYRFQRFDYVQDGAHYSETVFADDGELQSVTEHLQRNRVGSLTVTRIDDPADIVAIFDDVGDFSDFRPDYDDGGLGERAWVANESGSLDG